jgi:hypothetical protein
MAHVTGHSSLIKTILHKSLAEGVYRDIVTRSSNYYYFLGTTLPWGDELNPPYPVDSYAYERLVRSDIITLKQINPTDVSFVINRTNWISGEIYDMYDDEYSNQIVGYDIISGGTSYTSLPTITITGGGGFGAAATAVLFDGQLVDIDIVSKGEGYTSQPTVTVTGGGGVGANVRAVLNLAFSGASKLEDSKYYVMTEDFNLYKCLDNNNNSRSTIKPLGTSITPIETSDGYRWKFMYNVPINLRSKFLSDLQIPVVSALTNQFYSNGTLDNIIINNKGINYTSATITVTGDGFRQEDPTFLTGVVVSAGGTGYTSPTLTIGNPVSSSSAFVSGASVFLGQNIYSTNFDFYEIVTPGTLSSTPPTHRFGTVQNGTAALKYVGTKAKGTVTCSGGAVTAVTLTGSVREVNLISGGFGYTSAPPVIISGGGGGSGVVATAKMNATTGSVLYVVITNSGDNYTVDPDVLFGNTWTASTAVLVGQQYIVSNRLYTVTGAGTTHASIAPTHTSGSATNGTATFTYAGQPAVGAVVRRFGAGYAAAPTISVTQPGGSGVEVAFQTAKSEAKLLPILDSGQIVGITVENAGIGYSTATIAVSGDGTGAALSADLNIGNIQSLQANNEILTVAGTIDAIKVISGGYGYGVANVEIQGDGTGATATATINSATGRISKINITDPGQGYTFANVVINGNGRGAKMRAIMPPYGGHGKNSPDELFARTLMFYSNVSTDLNQGVAVNNDYRQLGIIKNPREYGLETRYQSSIGSACFIVQAAINTLNFPADTNVTVDRVISGQTFQRNYRVVACSATSALLQSLDNDTPTINDVFTNATGQTFAATSVGNPTIDKYSGQMMFIDNKAGFTPSADETVTLRTVIRF